VDTTSNSTESEGREGFLDINSTFFVDCQYRLGGPEELRSAILDEVAEFVEDK